MLKSVVLLNIFMKQAVTMKIGRHTHDQLSSKKQEMKESYKKNVTFDDVILTSLYWRSSIKIEENKNQITFNISYIEFDEKMIELEVGCYPLFKYNDEKYIQQMIDPGRVVIKDEKIRVLFDYPLSHVVEIESEKKGGFARKDILKIVGDGYVKIYDDEEKSMKNTIESKFLNNRGKSDGIHGIWGHVMKDLYLENLIYDKKTCILRLGIGS